MRARTATLLGLAAVAVAALVAPGCSLGLDASLIGAADASVDAPASGDGATDAADDRGNAPPPPGSCRQDSDCKNPSACVKAAHCDQSIHLCAFDVCTVAACQAATCDTMSNSCSVPSSFGFHASSFRVTTGGVACGSASRCFAAAFPFVFVGTTNGVVAYNVVDPSSSSPPTVAVGGVPFLPTRIATSGRRVWFIGSVVGSGPTYHLAVAWLDVPQNPFVTALAASTAFVAYPQPSVPDVFPSTNGAVFLVHPDPGKEFPAVLLTAPVQDASSVTLNPSPGIAAGASVLGASGTRLVTYRYDGSSTYLAAFSFETAAGTTNAQNAGEATATAMGTVYPQGFFAFGPTGSVLWSTPATNVPDGGPFDTYAARMTWLVDSDKDTSFAQASKVDIETYSPSVGFGQPVAGPMAWIDKDTALVIAAAKQDVTRQTAVQVAQRATLPASLVAGRRYVLPVDVNHVGAAASGGFAYVLAHDDPMNQSATVHVFAPSCM